MRQRAARAVPAIASVLAIGLASSGCSAAGSASAASSAAAPTASAAFYGPPGPDAACVNALKAEQTLRTRQGKDQTDESAIDRDFMNFANALTAAAQREKHPATAQAMTALANDYTDLVQSQSGAAQLPSISTIQNAGATFDKACS